jgi:hypothetical protein
MIPQQAEQRRGEQRSERASSADLDALHGFIGMPVVAAAAQYPAEARNPACRPARFAVLDHEDAVA